VLSSEAASDDPTRSAMDVTNFDAAASPIIVLTLKQYF
jgi:hypothetical protein